VSWDQRFFDPIMLPGQKPLATLRDAGQYITKLPKPERDAEEWQAAMLLRLGRVLQTDSIKLLRLRRILSMLSADRQRIRPTRKQIAGQ
jgi:hypothetical protein